MDKPQTTEPEAKTEAAPEPKPAESGERKVPESALTKQAEDFRAENAKLAKQLAAVESEKLKAKEQKMVEDGKLKELIEAREKTIADLTASAATSARSLLESSAREQLRSLGMSDPLYLQGALAGLPADATKESVTEWAKLIKADNATAFTAPVTVVGQASLPGGPATDAGGSDLAARLKSDDPKVRAEAYNEQFKNDMSNIGG
jgi:hypothetical protein